MRISDWSSDVCSSDLIVEIEEKVVKRAFVGQLETPADPAILDALADLETGCRQAGHTKKAGLVEPAGQQPARVVLAILQIEAPGERSEEHTSELQSLMRISYAVFCLKKKKTPY